MEMKKSFVFTLTTELKDVLALFVKEAGKNRTEGYPDGVYVKGNVISAANSAVSLQYQLGQDETGLVPTLFEKPVLIPQKGIRAILDSSTNSEITVSATDRMISISKGKKGKVQITALDETTFPEFSKFDLAGVDKISAGNFVDAVNSVKFSIADNNKPIFTGMFFQGDGQTLSFSALNGYQASMVKMPYKCEETFKVSIPRACIDTVIAAVSKRERNDTLSIVRAKDNRHAAFFVGSRLVIRTRLIDGEPVDVGNFIIPNPYKVRVKKSEILSVLKSITTIREDIRTVVALNFRFSEKELDLDYKATLVSLSDSISFETENSADNADNLTVGVNVNYLAEAIKAIGSEDVEFSFSSPFKPLILSDTDEKVENFQVVVPVRLSK